MARANGGLGDWTFDAAAWGARTLGGIDPDRVSAYMCAADAVLVPSEYEGFGLATLEALGCGVPVIATPTGVAPEALSGIDGTYCLPFDLGTWREALAAILADPDPHVAGAGGAAEYASDAMAAQAIAVYRATVEQAG